MILEINSTDAAAAVDALNCFGRLPKAGQRIAGLTRASINQLILGNDPPVESRLWKSSAKSKRGIRLIKLRGPNSLENFILNLPR
jgi:hypothetical protein